MNIKDKKEFYKQYCEEWQLLFNYNLENGNVKENEKLINEKRKLEKSLGIIHKTNEENEKLIHEKRKLEKSLGTIHKTNEENRKLLVLQVVIYIIAIVLILL